MTTKNIVFQSDMVKATLINIAQQQNYSDKYAVDEMAARQGITILRLPPYHCELNPIESVWAQVKGHVAQNNKTFKLQEVKKIFEEGIAKVTPDKWSDCVSHTIKEEDKMCHLDHVIDDVTDRFIISVTDSGSDSSDTEN